MHILASRASVDMSLTPIEERVTNNDAVALSGVKVAAARSSVSGYSSNSSSSSRSESSLETSETSSEGTYPSEESIESTVELCFLETPS